MHLTILRRLRQRFDSLRWRLGISFALLALVVTALLTGIAVYTITTISLFAQRENAVTAVSGAATAFSDAITLSTVDPAQSAHQLGLAAGGRILWLGPEGVVRVDGEGDTGLAGRHLELPENLTSQDLPAAQIYTAGNCWVAYAIAPLKISSQPAGSLLLIRDLEAVKWEFYELRKRLWGTGAILALAFTLLGFLVAGSLSRPLEAITRAAFDMQAGKLQQSVPVEGSLEIARLAEAFNDMAARVAELDEQRRAFIADAAHELRTPLAALKALAEGMEGDQEELKGFIRQIDRLTRLVNNLLTLARLDNPQLKINPVSIRVIDLLDEVLWTIKPIAVKKDINLIFENREIQAWIIGDPDWLHRALVNVLDNAVRYTPKRGWVSITVQAEKDFTHIIIEDTGPGVPEETLSKLGTRFYRPSASRDRHTGGSGLGLSIAQEIIKLHEGYLSFNNVSGSGLCVKISLPQAPPEV